MGGKENLNTITSDIHKPTLSQLPYEAMKQSF
jgi:hypothetical protein